ncbi:MAG: hypothetical protein OXE98_06015 [Hyphomicrobiales bacterium]|nr:hypothetical protein [Hyphomicrobiales bacterium]
MATDDMKHEEKGILLEMFERNGKMSFRGILELLNLPSEESKYHLNKLIKRKFIKFVKSPYDAVVHTMLLFSGCRSNEGVYQLTDEGRDYVMEELKPNKNP